MAIAALIVLVVGPMLGLLALVFRKPREWDYLYLGHCELEKSAIRQEKLAAQKNRAQFSASAGTAEMKIFRTSRKGRLGFSLVESSISIGVLSFGFVVLMPLLGLGLSTSRHSRDAEMAAQIARTIEAEGRAGTLAAGSGYCDEEGNACTPDAARFLTQVTETDLAGNCTRLAIQVTPVSSPTHPASYAVVLPPP